MRKLEDFKIYVDGRSEEIQNKLFELSEKFVWESDTKRIAQYTQKPFLYIDAKGLITMGDEMNIFTEHPYTEIKADEILSMKIERKFKPFEKVLVRDDNSMIWRARFYDHCNNNGNRYKHIVTSGQTHKHCIPFKGNEHLHNTTNNPE